MTSAEPKMSTFLHSMALKKKVPVSATFELTSNCNFSCPMCYVHEGGKANSQLSAETWINLAKEARGAGTLFLLLTGGEPFLREDFAIIYEELAKMGFMISINTNGSLLQKHLPLLKKYPPTRVNISLYAAQKEQYKRFCGVDAFENVTTSIQLLQSAGINVRLNSVFTANNYEYASDIVSFAKERKLHLKSTAYSYPQIRLGGSCGENSARLTARQAALCSVESDLLKLSQQEFAQKAKRLCEVVDDNFESESFKKVRCRAGRCSFWLTWDGKMRPCAMMTHPETLPLQVGVKNAWKELNEKVEQIRLPVECSVCKRRKACPVCAAKCLSETGEFNGKPQYVCDMFESICSLSGKILSEKGFDNCNFEPKPIEEDFYEC